MILFIYAEPDLDNSIPALSGFHSFLVLN